MRSRAPVTAVVADLIGSALVLVVLAVHWQTVRIVRPAPFGPVTAELAGRTLQPAAFGLALVTLAGAVAALATRGVARRLVGLLILAAGTWTTVSAVLGVAPVGADRARALVARTVAGAGTGGNVVPLDDGTVAGTAHAVWPVLTAVAALLTVGAGIVWLLAPAGADRRGGLGARYEAPRAAQPARDATWWSALDHGDDPTAADERPGNSDRPHDAEPTGAAEAAPDTESAAAAEPVSGTEPGAGPGPAGSPAVHGGTPDGGEPATGDGRADRRTGAEHDPDANPARFAPATPRVET